jgi:hypothetical protein
MIQGISVKIAIAQILGHEIKADGDFKEEGGHSKRIQNAWRSLRRADMGFMTVQ